MFCENNILRNALLLFSFGAIVTTTLVLFKNQKELAFAIEQLSSRSKDVEKESKSDIKIIEKVVTSQPWAQIQDKSRDTVVQVIAQTAEIDILQPYKTPKMGGGFGSGFFINDEGEIITNNHVIDEAKSIWIKIPSLGKIIIDVELVGRSPERDIALLKVSAEGLKLIRAKLGKVPFLSLGDSDVVKRADEVLTLGYPLGQTSLKSTTGIVSGREHLSGHYLIQISSAINPGSSGGPSLSSNGQVVGITCSGIMSAQNIGYIIPINELKIILDDLRKTKLLRRPFLGVLLNNASIELTEYLSNPLPGGCYVVDVYQGSPLSKAGVKAGDMIYEINGHKLDIYGDLSVPWTEDKLSVVDYVTRLEIGQDVNILLYRNGSKEEISFKFDFSEQAPVRKIFVGDDIIDYEIFAGMLLQPLTLNHVAMLLSNAPVLAKYGEFKHQMEPALIVTHVVPNSQVQRLEVIREGAVITEINGKKIGTMKELRESLKSSANEKHITFKTSDGVFFVIDPKKALQETIKASANYQYPISDFIKELLKIAKISETKKIGISEEN